jgi:hypothetical protein
MCDGDHGTVQVVNTKQELKEYIKDMQKYFPQSSVQNDGERCSPQIFTSERPLTEEF